jgi:uncharacterized protein YutE (UPF0331/DUF86 family)
MDIFRTIAERRIEEAIQRGELDHLPLAGQPIPDDDRGIPDEERMAFRILKNAGVLPEELQLLKEVCELRARLARQTPDEAQRASLVRALNEKETQYHLLLERRRGRR